MSQSSSRAHPPEGKRSLIHEIALRAERAWDRLRLERDVARITVVPYLAHGNAERIVARGRVLSNPPVIAEIGPEPVWNRVRRMVARFESDEVAEVEVSVAVDAATGTTVSDSEGYYRVELTDFNLDPEVLFHEMRVSVAAPPGIDVHVGPCRVMVPTDLAHRIVVSDIDDTILETGAVRTAQMVMRTMTGSVWTRSWFPGVAELYQGLVRGAGGTAENPFFYVSSSPWNLYDFLMGFIQRSSLPTGPLFLRDLGIDETRFIKGSHDAHKRQAIEEILEFHDFPLILVGDSGQRDPEIYHDVAAAHPHRVEAVLLRHVADEARAEQVRQLFSNLDIAFVLGSDTTSLAVIAERDGLIPKGWSERVAMVTE